MKNFICRQWKPSSSLLCRNIIKKSGSIGSRLQSMLLHQILYYSVNILYTGFFSPHLTILANSFAPSWIRLDIVVLKTIINSPSSNKGKRYENKTWVNISLYTVVIVAQFLSILLIQISPYDQFHVFYLIPLKWYCISCLMYVNVDL